VPVLKNQPSQISETHRLAWYLQELPEVAAGATEENLKHIIPITFEGKTERLLRFHDDDQSEADISEDTFNIGAALSGALSALSNYKPKNGDAWDLMHQTEIETITYIIEYYNSKNVVPYSDGRKLFALTANTWYRPQERYELDGLPEEDLPMRIEEYLQRVNLIPHYDCHNLIAICYATLTHISIHGYSLNRCKHCGKFFVTANKADEKYCPHGSPEDEHILCKIIARRQLTKISKNSILQKSYKKTYDRLYARIKKDGSLREVLTQFLVDHKAVDDDRRHGKISQEEYLQWLDSYGRKTALQKPKGDSRNGK
jgi:hypothetical protein